MQEQITMIYCLCDDFLRTRGFKDDPQAKMFTAEVMTVALVAAAFFTGNQERSRLFLQEYGYIKHMLSKSRLNRRLHKIPDVFWQSLFALLAEVYKQNNDPQEYAVDSMPIPVCDNIRISRSHLYPRRQHAEAFRGYCASKRHYFYGLRLHLVITKEGHPVAAALAPASQADLSAFRAMEPDLPAGATLFADAAYLDRSYAAILQEGAQVTLITQQRKNSKEPLLPWVSYYCDHVRKRIETTFSQLAEGMARSIHAVTPRGFELKILLTLLAYSLAV